MKSILKGIVVGRAIFLCDFYWNSCSGYPYQTIKIGYITW